MTNALVDMILSLWGFKAFLLIGGQEIIHLASIFPYHVQMESAKFHSMQPHPFPTSQDTSRQLQEAAIDERLMMTPEERIEAHENARQLVVDLKTAGDIARAESESSS